MGLLELFLVAVGLSMDAFAVAVCKGLALRKVNLGQMALVGLWFGGFQALMPLIGYFVGVQFRDQITAVDHWIAFGLLAFIGGKMVYECIRPGEEEQIANPTATGKLLVLAVATSIDALAVGVTFAFFRVKILPAVTIIGLTTFCISLGGVVVGNFFGTRYKKRAELTGGIVLILLGAKILLEHLRIL